MARRPLHALRTALRAFLLGLAAAASACAAAPGVPAEDATEIVETLLFVDSVPCLF